MKCPYCSKEIHFEPTQAHAYSYDNPEEETEEEEKGFDIAHGFCPSCTNLIVLVRDGIIQLDQRGKEYLDPINSQEIAHPKNANPRAVPKEVPEKYSEDFDEACAVLLASPKASAAISRRLLQTIIREEYKISERSLAEEIDKFIKLKDTPSYIADAVDAVRNIGNFAAHPLKDTNTGEIVEVEPGEAEWLLDVLEAVFDFAFVQPEKLKARKESLNKKLADLGKPTMKDSANSK